MPAALRSFPLLINSNSKLLFSLNASLNSFKIESIKSLWGVTDLSVTIFISFSPLISFNIFSFNLICVFSGVETVASGVLSVVKTHNCSGSFS
jgi:hypothetical protein